MPWDSGALGLLFAAMEIEGGDVVAYYNDIVNVQNELNIDIVSSMLECAYYLKCDLTKRVAPSIT